MMNAIVRPPARSFTRAINSWYAKTHPKQELEIDYDKARWQHQQFTHLLERLGIRVFLLDPDERFPDGCFIQDPVVVVGREGLVLPMKELSRCGEYHAIANKLSLLGLTLYNADRGACDGGDIVVAKDIERVWVGRSERTDEMGYETIRDLYGRFGYRTASVPVTRCLHLGTGMSYLGKGRLLVSGWLSEHAQEIPAGVDGDRTGGVRIRQLVLMSVPAEESPAANVLVIDRTIVMADGYPYTKRLLERFGFSVITTPISEFEKADGSISCLALICEL
jgi:dimethylargininase